jgi:nicotinamide-nucleotide amidase
MFENAVRPILEKLSGGCIVSRSIRIFGMGESAVEDALHDLILGSTNPSVAPYAKTGEVMLRVTALADTKDEAFDMTLPVIDEITNTLPDCIYGVDCDSLEERAYSLLSERNMTLASAESCTGGLLAKRITDIPGSSGVFLGGVVPYSNEMKEAVLGIPREIIVEHGAVSEQTARMMADGVRGLSGADFGIGITGIAGPVGGSDEKPVGLVYVALAARDGTYCRKMMMGTYGGRDMIRARSVNTALDMLIRHLTGRPVIANMY